MEKVKYLIIGNGITGLSAAEQIRKIDSKGSMLIISQEDLPTYYRVKLSHYISKTFERDSLLVHDLKWYEDRNIELSLSNRVQEIDFNNKRVITKTGSVSYEKLLLANGSSPFMPPAKGQEKEGVFSLRTVQDLEKIQAYLANVNEVAIVGGGLLGLEAAWAVHELGKKVSIIEFAPFLMNRQLDEPLSQELKKMLQDNNFEINLGVGAATIKGAKKVESIELTDGRQLNCKAILYSCGIRSNTGLFNNTSLKVERGVVVNNKFETSIQDVYAAGDVAQTNGITLGLWTAGMAQGKIAGANMAGEPSEYVLEMPSTIFQVNNWRIFSTGKIANEMESIESPVEKGKLKLFFENGVLRGGVLINHNKLMASLKALVKQEPQCQTYLEKGISALDMINELLK